MTKLYILSAHIVIPEYQIITAIEIHTRIPNAVYFNNKKKTILNTHFTLICCHICTFADECIVHCKCEYTQKENNLKTKHKQRERERICSNCRLKIILRSFVSCPFLRFIYDKSNLPIVLTSSQDLVIILFNSTIDSNKVNTHRMYGFVRVISPACDTCHDPNSGSVFHLGRNENSSCRVQHDLD